MREEGGLYRLAGAVLGVILLIAAVAWLTGSRGDGNGAGDGGGDTGSLAVRAEDGRDGDGKRDVKRNGGDPGRADREPGSAGAACRVLGPAAALPDQVHEASGVAVSRTSPGTLWTHSDSGDPLLLAVRADGSVRGRVRVAGATVRDWEDVAAAPCGGGSCLYVADIGDNEASRGSITIYRLPEPDPAAGASAPAEAFHAAYPDGPRDAEALFVTADGAVHVVTKGETGPVAVYRFPRPLRAGSVARLERVATLTGDEVKRSGRVTGAAASPDGRWIALRTLDEVAFHPAADLAAGRTGGALRFDLGAAGEAQGEGVAVGPDGTVFLVSEGGKKEDPATLTRVSCPLPR